MTTRTGTMIAAVSVWLVGIGATVNPLGTGSAEIGLTGATVVGGVQVMNAPVPTEVASGFGSVAEVTPCLVGMSETQEDRNLESP